MNLLTQCAHALRNLADKIDAASSTGATMEHLDELRGAVRLARKLVDGVDEAAGKVELQLRPRARS